MSDVVACPRCGSGNATTMVRCWVCGTPIAGAPPLAAPPPPRDDTLAFRAIGWLALLAGLLFVGGLVAIELALEWPGLLVPYALVQLVVFAALARTAWVNLRRPPAPATPADGSPARSGVSGEEVVQGVALALTIALVVIALLALLAVAAVILFMMVCFGVIAVSGM